MLTEILHDGGFIVSEAPKTLSRDQITLKSGQAGIGAGTVLGAVTTGTATETHAGNTGNGVMGAMTVGDGAKAGLYKLKITAAATNAGAFELYDPSGVMVGVGNVAAAYAGGGLSFTLADGSADFVLGDTFLITVVLTTKYVQLNLTATDGSERPAGVLYGYTDATSADMQTVAMTRNCELNAGEIVWPAGITTAQQAGFTALLAGKGIVLR